MCASWNEIKFVTEISKNWNAAKSFMTYELIHDQQSLFGRGAGLNLFSGSQQYQRTSSEEIAKLCWRVPAIWMHQIHVSSRQDFG